MNFALIPEVPFKLEAFLALYDKSMPVEARAASALMRLWNQIDVPGVTPASAWHAFARALEPLGSHGTAWADHLASLGGLADNLVRFCAGKLKSS